MDPIAGFALAAFWLFIVVVIIFVLHFAKRTQIPFFLLAIILFAATIVLLSANQGSYPSNYVYFQVNIDQRRQECSDCHNMDGKIRVIFAENADHSMSKKTFYSKEEKELMEQERILMNDTDVEIPFVKNATVVNPHNFKWIILEKNVCTGSRRRPFILIVVHSAPKNWRQRMFIRETWGAPDLCQSLNALVVFALGSFSGPSAARQQKAVQREHSVYRDIIQVRLSLIRSELKSDTEMIVSSDEHTVRFKAVDQEDFVDSYRNLTYKTVMWLRWATFYCPDAKYVLKLDDDIFANTFNLVKHVKNMFRRNIARHNTLACNVWNGVKVDRNTSSKWFVPKTEFALDFYPTYCSGSAYLMSSDLVPKLYYASYNVPFFWVDDFWLTGQVAVRVNASWYQMRSMFSLIVKNRFVYEESFTEDYIVFGHVPHVKMKEKYRVWKRIAAANGFLYNREGRL